MKKIEKNAWFEEGLKVLSNEGFQRITIDNLCSFLNITKGSFYHHFKNIDGYVEALMKYWLNKNTVEFINATEKLTNIEEKQMLLNDLAASASQKAEQVIRAWSFSNETVRKYVQQVDDMRMEYLIDLHKQAGIDVKSAKDHAIIEYGTLIGIQQLCPNISKEEFKHLYLIFFNKVRKYKK